MIETLQNYLFPKMAMVPQKIDDEGYMVYFGGARRHKTIRMDEGEYRFRCEYNPKDPFIGAGRESLAFPPLHFHRQQSEEVQVVQGRIKYVLDGKEGTASGGSTLILPLGHIHTFWIDPTSEENVIMEFTARPGRGLDERWIDSFYGIINSAYETGTPMSFLQVMVFCDEAVSAPGNMPKWLAIAVTYIFGHWIGRLAGYKGLYDQYDNTTGRTKKLV